MINKLLKLYKSTKIFQPPTSTNSSRKMVPPPSPASSPNCLVTSSSTSTDKSIMTTSVAATTTTTTTTTNTCNGCGKIFGSRNAVFKHLKETVGACLLTADNRDDYEKFVHVMPKTAQPDKVAILFGYLPFAPPSSSSSLDSSSLDDSLLRIRNGQDAGKILLQAVDQVQKEMEGVTLTSDSNGNGNSDGDGIESTISTSTTLDRINRSYGNLSRKADCLRQDDNTSTISEVMTVRLHPLRRGVTVDEWLDRVQEVLETTFAPYESSAPIRILGRQDVPTKFDAETDVSQRRVEYLLPVEFLTWSLTGTALDRELKAKLESNLSPFSENHKHNLIPDSVTDRSLVNEQPEEDLRLYLLDLKNKMKLFTTKVVDVDVVGKESFLDTDVDMGTPYQDNAKRLRIESKSAQAVSLLEGNSIASTSRADGSNLQGGKAKATDGSRTSKDKTRRFVKRRRFHNFTPRLLAHDFYAYRRLDRLYHRATLRLPASSPVESPRSTYVVLSMTGDLVLTGQVARIVGVVLALANSVIDPSFCDCVFDEEYPHLVPTPQAPLFGVVSAEAHYANAEGKAKCILSPRVCSRYDKGWNQPSTIRRVKAWQGVVYDHVAREWGTRQRDSSGRLSVEREWTETILLPWVEKAKHHLVEYSKLKTKIGLGDGIPRGVSVKDDSVPVAFREVLYRLRQLDGSGEWPSTTPKRQMVMVSTSLANSDGERNETKIHSKSLAVAFAKAKNNKLEAKSSAYSYKEGQGGASGSFSVGYMPGGINKQPKANALFPDLVKAAFQLERRLFPNRQPSSTIAINRNAQFRPHTDSGAGAGQSTSLIVAIGAFSGGELMVEGEKYDIRYKGLEFDGWKQRHWTMPFEGERFSLVWFTPKGCEGHRGIDLEL